MLLFSPSTGQIIDRLSILELKIKASKVRGFDTSALEAEVQACHEALVKKIVPVDRQEEYKDLTSRLRGQNQGQWESETTLRRLTDSFSAPPTYEELLNYANSMRTRDEGNELRAFLVSAIDSLFNEVVERKMYR